MPQNWFLPLYDLKQDSWIVITGKLSDVWNSQLSPSYLYIHCFYLLVAGTDWKGKSYTLAKLVGFEVSDISNLRFLEDTRQNQINCQSGTNPQTKPITLSRYDIIPFSAKCSN